MKESESVIKRYCDFHKNDEKKKPAITSCYLCGKDVCENHMIGIDTPMEETKDEVGVREFKMMIRIMGGSTRAVCFECAMSTSLFKIMQSIQKKEREELENATRRKP